MEAKDTRRSDRVSLAIPVEVMGNDLSGEFFKQEGRTLIVSRHGAAIVVNRKLVPHQEITIRCLPTKQEADAQVVGQVGGQEGSYIYGMAFLDPTVNIWNIHFPPKAEGEQAAGRLLLECGGCHTREVAYLHELEVEVYEANKSLSRSCKTCRDYTIWKESAYEAPPEREAPTPLPEAAGRPAAPAPRTQNERKHVRLGVKLQACVRHAGFEDEIVATENVSRGGMCFKSHKIYLEGSRIDVAIPYSPYGANIFVPARIMRVQEITGENMKLYGVMYLKAPRTSGEG
jgi:hypothetical protein